MNDEIKEKLIYSLGAAMGYFLVGAGIGMGIGTVLVWILYLYDFI